MTSWNDPGTTTTESPGRRTVLKRTALIGGTMVWATPVVQSIAAPALAVGGSPVNDLNGLPSYVILFIECGTSPGTYYQVKYERQGETATYSETCMGAGENGLSGNVRNPRNGDMVCYQGYLGVKGARNYAGSCDNAVVSGAASPNGDALLVTLGAGCRLVGWFLHDGTCADVVSSGNGHCRWSGDGASDVVGPSVPTTSGGTFTFDKCAR